MGSKKTFFLGVVVAGALVACGGDDKGSSSGSTSSSSGGSSSSSGSTDPDAGVSTTPTPKAVPAPTIDGIMKMAGALHVVWSNPADTTCDKIAVERKSDTEAYKVVYTLPGEADNKHDGTATKDTTYTYRVQCLVGTESSDYSNEKSANPMK
jgi:hypothetical protein